jgi:hypothetical protein
VALQITEPVTVYGDDEEPRLSGATLDQAAEYVNRMSEELSGPGNDDLYIQDADGGEFELLSTGKWNAI